MDVEALENYFRDSVRCLYDNTLISPYVSKDYYIRLAIRRLGDLALCVEVLGGISPWEVCEEAYLRRLGDSVMGMMS